MTRPDDMAYVLDNLERMVVKAVSESGGYGMLMGPTSTPALRAEFAKRIRENPRNYIAQPVVPCRATSATSTASWSRATSTCAPTSSTARTSRSCRAGSPGWP